MYLAGGIAYNMKQRQLSGVEAIPHVEFWKDLPLLVKDGATYVVNKGKGYTSV